MNYAGISMNKALFLDRDGIINVDKKHLFRVEECEFVDGIVELCQYAIKCGYIIIIVTNQAGIAKGYYTESDMHKLHEHIRLEFSKNDIEISGIYYCPHHPDYTGTCNCRKPEPGMILSAKKDHNIDLGRSILIGDKLSDAEAGDRAGVGYCLVVKGLYDISGTNKYRIFENLMGVKTFIMQEV